MPIGVLAYRHSLAIFPVMDSSPRVDALARRFARVVQFRDGETAEHLERMSRSCGLIARQLGWDHEECTRLRAASELHDIGKVGVPDSVLRKPSPLDSRERTLVERHTQIGHEILAGSGDDVLELGALIALTHHERCDGKGYPRRLDRDEIPVEGRIAAAADVFDALSHRRVYRDALEPDEALEMMLRERGKHFDPDVLDAFEAVVAEVVEISATHPDSWEPEPTDSSGAPAAPSDPVTVLLVEDHDVFAKGLALLLRREGIALAGTASGLAQARALLDRRRPQVALVGLEVAGESGLELVPAAHAAGTRVLVYADSFDGRALDEARAAEADGLASRASSAGELIEAIRTVAGGRPFLDSGFAAAERSRPPTALTSRQREVVGLLADGMTGEEIAVRLFLSPETVRKHVKNAMMRLGARTRAQLVALAASRHEIAPPPPDAGSGG